MTVGDRGNGQTIRRAVRFLVEQSATFMNYSAGSFVLFVIFFVLFVNPFVPFVATL